MAALVWAALAAERLVLNTTVTPSLRSAVSACSAPGVGATLSAPVFSQACQRASL